LFFKQFKKTDESLFFSEHLNECIEKLYRAHLPSSEYNHHAYAKAHALATKTLLWVSPPFFHNSI